MIFFLNDFGVHVPGRRLVTPQISNFKWLLVLSHSLYICISSKLLFVVERPNCIPSLQICLVQLQCLAETTSTWQVT